MIDAMEKEIRNPTFAFLLLFLSPSLSFASPKPFSCSPLSSLSSGTRKQPFIASNPRFHLQTSVSETLCFWNVPDTTRTRADTGRVPVCLWGRVACRVCCRVEADATRTRSHTGRVNVCRFFLNLARILQNKSKLTAVPHSIDISIKYDSFSSSKHRFGSNSRSGHR